MHLLWRLWLRGHDPGLLRCRPLPAWGDRHAEPEGLDRAEGRAHRRLVLSKYHETVDPAEPDVVLFSPSGAPNPYYAEYGWAARPACRSRCPAPTPSGASKRAAADAGSAGRRWCGTMARAWSSAARSPSTRTICSRSTDEEENPRVPRSRCRPYALISRASARPNAGLLHPARGPDRRARRSRPEGDALRRPVKEGGTKTFKRPAAGSASPTSTGPRP